jgi:cytochrome c oxidase assembly factor CtaG/polyferredoxin
LDPTLAAAFASWSFDPWVVLALVAVAVLYLRGFCSLRRRHPERFPRWRASAFLLGLAVFLVAIASPVDAFADLLLQVHMAQHLLLMMVAPPLVWLGAPINPLLQGMPRSFLKQGLGPFLAWPALQRLGAWLVHPITAWLAFVGTTWVWHAPRLYETALRSPFWHEVEHLCFFAAALLFWFPVLQPWPSRPAWPRAAMLPYLVLAGLQMTAFSALFSFSGRPFYPIYADMPRLWGISVLEDQAAAGAVMWVPSSVILLIATVWLVVTLLESPVEGRSAPALRHGSGSRSGVRFDLLRLRIVGPLLGSLAFRRMAQTVLFGLACAIVLDGLLGPSAASRNLAGVLPWTYARAFAVLGLLVAGNLFCFACPFTLPRSLARRLLGGEREAPRWLRTKWTAVTLFLLFLVGYEAFDLWDSPWWTAWILVGYFAAAFVVDGLYGGASFCRGVCPIGQFQFVGSTISPLEVRMRDPAVCASCLTHDCLRGGPKGPGCDLDLFQPTKIGNLDCTFCLDCTRACPHENVGVGARLPGSSLVTDGKRAAIGRLTRRRDLAAFALVFCFGAFANAAAMVAPVAAWEREFGRRLGLDSERLSIALLLLLAVVLAPWLSTALAGRLGGVLSRLPLAHEERRGVMRHLGFSLLPLGFAMWLAHFSFHLATAGGALSLAVGRVARWLDLPAHAMSAPPLIAADALLPWEITALGLGLWVTLLVAWRIAFDAAHVWRPALGLFAPWAVLASALWAAGLWILFQPMEMRGMAMG